MSALNEYIQVRLSTAGFYVEPQPDGSTNVWARGQSPEAGVLQIGAVPDTLLRLFNPNDPSAVVRAARTLLKGSGPYKARKRHLLLMSNIMRWAREWSASSPSVE